MTGSVLKKTLGVDMAEKEGGSRIGAQGKGAMDGASGAVYALREGPAQGQETARGPLGPWRALISPPSRVRRSFVQRGY